MKKKTLTDLKRSIGLKVRMNYRYGNDIPEKLQGIRTLVSSNSVGVTFRNEQGEDSELRIRRATLVDYTDDEIIVYNYGLRDLNEKEKDVLARWKKISDTKEFQEEARIDMLSDGSSTYWRKKWFFSDEKMEYLMGAEFQNGLKYDYSTGKIFDFGVRGEKILGYEIIKN